MPQVRIRPERSVLQGCTGRGHRSAPRTPLARPVLALCHVSSSLCFWGHERGHQGALAVRHMPASFSLQDDGARHLRRPSWRAMWWTSRDATRPLTKPSGRRGAPLGAATRPLAGTPGVLAVRHVSGPRTPPCPFMLMAFLALSILAKKALCRGLLDFPHARSYLDLYTDGLEDPGSPVVGIGRSNLKNLMKSTKSPIFALPENTD
uniref:Uncharacterized protein n=1 Tax=Arundo donax TaxID=35708 RepID=A0A0A9GP30_ARUDO